MKSFFIFLIQYLASQNSSNYISNINVLLPLTQDKQVMYEIEAYNGCFTWTSSAPHIISVEGIVEENSCSAKAVLKVQTTEEQERMVWITATDKNNGHKLTCEAKVAKIQRIQILTKKKTVLVDDLETLELQAYDAKGNVFSSLEGINFIWSIKQHKANAEFLSLKKALKKTSQLRYDIEEQNYHSDIVILKGLENGVIKINTKVHDGLYVDIHTQDTLYIIENFIIYPFHDVQVLPCSQIQFDLYKIKFQDNKQIFNKINLPSSQFQWIIEPESAGQIFQSGKFIASKELAQTKLVVMDSSNNENKITTKITIVEPQSVELQINPYTNDLYEYLKYKVITNFEHLKKFERFENNWNLVQGRKYIIKVNMLDDMGRNIETEGFQFNFTFSKQHVALYEQFDNILIISTIDLTQSEQIIVEFPTQQCIENTLITSKSFNVNSQVAIFKLQDKVHLPYQESQNQQQIYQFTALGGSKYYDWSTSNQSVGLINSKGVFEVHAVGNAIIKCSDRNNHSNYEEIEMIVEKVTEIKFSDNKKEMLLNEKDQVFVTAFGESNTIFANCTSLDFQIIPSEDLNPSLKDDNYESLIQQIKVIKQKRKYSLTEDIYAINENQYEFYLINGLVSESELKKIIEFHQNYGYCKAMLLNPKQQGLFELELEANKQKQNIPVMVFKKPQLIFPDGYLKRIYGENATIAPGSSISFLIQDGIRPWSKSGLIQNRVFYQNQECFDVQIQEINQNSTKVTVKCSRPFSSPQEFQIQSFSSEDLNEPLITTVDFVINCKDPSFIAISPIKYFQNSPENLLKLPQKQFELQNESQHELVIKGFNEQNIPFWNITSIVTDWNGNDGYGKIVSQSNNSASLELNDQFGEFKVTAKSNHYDNKLKFPQLENTVTINSFKPLKIQEENTIILNNPENIQNFHLKNGSGSFQVSLEDPSIADLDYDQTQRLIKITPKREGETFLVIKDLNQDFQSEVKQPLNIVQVDQIQLDVDDNVKVRGSIFHPRIIFKAKQNEIPSNQLKYIDYEIQVSGKQSDIQINDQSQIYVGRQGKYNVNVHLKDTNLFSNTIEIAAFDYISSFPQEIHTLKGCKSLMKIIGGPDANMMINKDFHISMHQDNQNLKIKKIKDNIYEISSSNNGKYEIQIGLWQKDQQVSHSKTNIVVGEMTGVYLSIPQVVYIGTTVRGLAIPQIDSHLMSPGICEMEFEIENFSSQNLIIYKKHHFRSIADQKFSIAGFDIHAIEKGVGNIKVSLKNSKQEVASSEQQISIQDKELLETTHFLNSEEKCKNCSSFILMKPNSSMQLETHKNLEVDPEYNCRVVNSMIQCGNKVGNQILVENNDNGFMNAAVLSVQNPHSLIVQNADKNQLQSESIKLDLNIFYLNKQGYVFQNDNLQNEFQFLVSDTEVLNAFIHENKLTINTQKQGFSYVYVQSLVYPHLFDIFEINVGKFVEPSGVINLHIGDEITFENLQNKTFSDWHISNQQLATINQNGKLQCSKEGSVDVLLGAGGVTVAQVKNHIITQLKSLDENPQMLTNIPNHHSFKKQYEVLFQGFENNHRITLFKHEKLNNSLKVECTSSLNFLIISPIMEREKGLFGCSISFDKKQEIDESQGSLKIVLKSIKQDQFFVESRYHFQVVTLFQVQKNINSIYLNKSQRSHKLRIKTNHPLIASTKNEKNLSLESNYDGSKSLQTIIVKANGDQDFNDTLLIKSNQNNQSQEIKIHFKKQKPWIGFSFSFSSWLDWILLIIFIWVVLYLLNCYYRKTQENQPQYQRQYPVNSTNISNISGIYGVNKQDTSNIYPRREMNNSLYDSGLQRRNPGLYQ